MVSLPRSLLLMLFCMPALMYAGESSTDVNPIQYRVHVSSTTVWERQQITVVAEVSSPDRFATLIIDSPKIEGFEVFTIPHSREQHPDGNQLLRTGWILFPLQPGQHTISLPAVSYRLGGAIQQVFNTPVFNVKVRALPPYIPPTIPVGKVNIESYIEPAGLLKTDHLSYWHITLQATSVPPVWMPPVLRYIKSSSEVKFLSASSERTVTPDTQGIHGKVVHHIPLKALSNGRLSPPVIQFQYFEPDSGRIKTIKYKPENIISLSATIRVVLAGTFILFTLILLRKAFIFYQIRTAHQRARKHALDLISQAHNARELRHALRCHAAAEGWDDNITLTRWLSCCTQHYQVEHPLPHIIDTLTHSSYGKTDKSGLGDIPDRLVAILATAKKIKPEKRNLLADTWGPEALFRQR